MVARYGMCESLGTVAYLNDGEVFIGRDYQNTVSYSEKFAGTIDDEVKALIDRAYRQCTQILQEHKDQMAAVVAFLIEHENMTGAQFTACMEGRPIDGDTKPSLFDSAEGL